MVRTTTKGIFQSDILIRTAVINALDEIKANPWLLDFIFAWLPADDLTLKDYGARELQEAKDWFLSTDISVVMSYRTDRPQIPCIGIELVESTEAGANSLGDVHYEPYEDIDVTEIVIKPKPVLGPFTPKLYSSATGLITLPDGLSTASVFAGNILYDAVANKGYPIVGVPSDATFQIDKGIAANFTRAYVAPASSFYTARLESVEFQEAYRLRCFVNTSAVHLTFLHSIVLFILLRSKEKLLEARGFERTTLRSQGVTLDQNVQGPELIFVRDVVITGFVRQFWPKEITPKIDGLIIAPIKILDGGHTPDGIAQSVADQGWEMEQDQFSSLRKV